MHILLELYSPKPSWLSLPQDDRSRFVAGIREAVAAMESTGATCLALGRADPAFDHASPHSYFGVWSARDRAGLSVFLDGLRASGWYEYFDHVNGGGRDDGLALTSPSSRR